MNRTPATIETARLLLRPWSTSEADVVALQALTREPGLDEFSISGYASFSEEQARAWLAREARRFQKAGLGKFAVTLREGGDIIGIAGIFELLGGEPHEVEINYRFPHAWRGKGYATEAARAVVRYGLEGLRVPEVNAVLDPRNTPSRRIAERLGMVLRGTFPWEGRSYERWSILRTAP